VVYGLVGLKTTPRPRLGGAARRVGYPPLHAHRDWELQPSPHGVRRPGLLSATATSARPTQLFNYAHRLSRSKHWRKLLVAPVGLRNNILELIERGVGQPDGRINHEDDTAWSTPDHRRAVQGLAGSAPRSTHRSQGSAAWSGVPGQSEHIRVRSLVGPLPEHISIYRFGKQRPWFSALLTSLRRTEPRNLRRDGSRCWFRSRTHLQGGWQRSSTATWPTTPWPGPLGPDGSWARVPQTPGSTARRVDGARHPTNRGRARW